VIHTLTLNSKILVGSNNGDFAAELFDKTVAERVFTILAGDSLNIPELTPEDISNHAKAHLIDAQAAVIIGEMAGFRKLDAIRMVRHLLHCGLGEAKAITEFFMGLSISYCVSMAQLDHTDDVEFVVYAKEVEKDECPF
jgi:hypothetical protein